MRKIYCDYCDCEIGNGSVHIISISIDNKNRTSYELCDKCYKGVIIDFDFSRLENKNGEKK
jgi:hypothetical protein